MKKLKGFTLTELMIALSVIGILVAVVTPAIMKTRPNKNKMMIKKTFYTTEQIVSSLINDERLYPDMRDDCGRTASEGETLNCAWGFDYTGAVTYEGVTYSGDSKFENLFTNMLNVKSQNLAEHTYITSDGVEWNMSGASTAWPANQSTVGTFTDTEGSAGIKTILIDVNGKESPNCRQTETNCSEDDFDQYQIQILANGKLRINPDDSKAVDFVTINTSIKDNMN